MTMGEIEVAESIFLVICLAFLGGIILKRLKE